MQEVVSSIADEFANFGVQPYFFAVLLIIAIVAIIRRLIDHA